MLLCLLTPLAAVAVGYGDDQQAVACRYRVTGKANVRSKPDVKRGAIMYTLRAGDYIYVDEDREYEGNGSQYNWVKISGSGQNVTVVPFFLDFPISCSFSTVLPRSNEISYSLPSRRTSTTTRFDSAFTTDTPTP